MSAPALLVQPPLCDPFAPTLALPALAAALRQGGVEVRCADLNLELHEALATDDGIELARRDAEAERRLLAGSAGGSMVPSPPAAWRAARGRAALEESDLARRIAEGHRALRDSALHRLGEDGVLLLAGRMAGWPLVYGMLAFSPAPFSAARARAILAGREPLPFLSWLRHVAVPRVLAEAPAWVGISVSFEQQLLPALVLAGLLKDRGVAVFLGGFHVSALGPEGLAADPDLVGLVDGVVIGEGEAPILELDAAARSDRAAASVPGLWLPGSAADMQPARHPDLSRLPAPDFSALPLGRYLAPALVLPYQGSRGCWFGRCAFCNFAAVSPGWRQRPLPLLLDDVQAAAGIGQALTFADEAIPAPRLRRIAEGMAARGVSLPWEAMCRFDRRLDRATLDAARASGCRTLFFGLEAASPRIASLMGKGLSGEVARRNLEDCAEAGINLVLSAIVGFPGETRQDARLTLAALAWARARFGDRVIVDGMVHPFRLARGSRAWRQPERFGLRVAGADVAGPLGVTMPHVQVASPEAALAGPEGDPLLRQEDLASIPPPAHRAAAAEGEGPRLPRHDLMRLVLEACNLDSPGGFRTRLLAARARTGV